MHVMHDDRGAAALLIAAGMVLFLGMAALAVDLGLGFNERRQDQASVDAGVMAGALSAIEGQDILVLKTLEFVEDNLPTTYIPGDWQTLWEGCVDPATERNAGGFNFVALNPPTGWTPIDAANWCISFESARGLLRVKTPTQLVPTTFGRVLGVDELKTSAFAIAKLSVVGDGGILPFGVPFGSGDGGHICMSSSPSGLSVDPCTGPTAGNFGPLNGRKFGNPDIPTMMDCNPSPPGQVLAENIAHGLDHVVVPDADGVVANEVRDLCFNPLVDTLQTRTGFPNNGAEVGLVGDSFGSAYGYTPRLAQSTNLATVFGRSVDDTPLWTFLNNTADYGSTALPTSDDAPASCAPSTFNNALPPFDWDGDSILDQNESWQHMESCIDSYVAGSYTGEMFLASLGDNGSRFAYVPEFYESSLGSGSSWLHILRFRAVYLQTTLWKQGMTFVLQSPGEGCADPATGSSTPCTGPHGMIQLTSFVFPDDALPIELRGSFVTPGGGVNPFNIELFK